MLSSPWYDKSDRKVRKKKKACWQRVPRTTYRPSSALLKHCQNSHKATIDQTLHIQGQGN